MTTARTIKDGATPTDRAIFSVTQAAVPTADPTAADAGLSLRGADWLHVYTSLDPTVTALSVTPWYRSAVTGEWHEGVQLSFSPALGRALVEVRGEDHVFFVLDAVTGTGSIRLWAAASYDGQDA